MAPQRFGWKIYMMMIVHINRFNNKIFSFIYKIIILAQALNIIYK